MLPYKIPNQNPNSATAGQKWTTYQPTHLYQFPTLKKRTLFITNLSAKFIILVMTTYVRGMLLLLCTRRKRVWKLKIASKVHRKCTGHKDSSWGLMYQKKKCRKPMEFTKLHRIYLHNSYNFTIFIYSVWKRNPMYFGDKPCNIYRLRGYPMIIIRFPRNL